MSNAQKYFDKKGRKGKPKPYFDEISVLLSHGKAAKGIGSVDQTDLTYTELHATALANARNRKYGSNIPGFLNMLDYPIGPANPLNEYIQTHYTRHEDDNPFLPKEIIKIDRQGLRYYAIRLDKKTDFIPLINLKVPKTTYTGPATLMKILIQNYESQGQTDHANELREIVIKKAMKIDGTKVNTQEFETFNFSEITPLPEIPTKTLEDHHRITNKQYHRLTRFENDGQLTDDLHQADLMTLKNKQRQWLSHLREITRTELARKEIFR